MEDYKKKYEEVIKRAKEELKVCGSLDCDAAKQILRLFPELKESEDEKIRKELIQYLKDYPNLPNGNCCRDDFFSWLEKQGEHANFRNKIQIGDKVTRNEDGVLVNLSQLNRVAKKDEKQSEQKETLCDKCRREQPSHSCQDITALGRCYIEGEQKPTDKVEPKFHEGEWVIGDKDNFVHQIKAAIENVSNGKYAYDLVDGGYISTSHESDYHLWTIQDAKDGDVLEFGDHGRLVTGILSFVNKITGNVDVSCLLEGDKFKVGVFYNLDTVKPHPSTKEQRELLFQKMKESGYEWDAKKKELKKIDSCESDIDFKIEADKWYVCIKDYYYSDIDELMFTKGKAYKAYIDWGFISNNGTKKTPIGIFPYKEYFRPATDEEIPHEQKPAEWSEEDEKFFKSCLWHISNSVSNGKCTDSKCQLTDWLKSIKERYTWKPSQVQLSALSWEISNTSEGSWQREAMQELYDTLLQMQ